MTHLPGKGEYRTIAFDTEKKGEPITFYWGFEPNTLDPARGGTIRMYEIHTRFLAGGMQSTSVKELEAMQELRRLENQALQGFNIAADPQSAHYKGTRHYSQNPQYAQELNKEKIEKLRGQNAAKKFRL